MTEAEMALTLGFVPDPIKNKVKKDPLTSAEVWYLLSVFEIRKQQLYTLGRFSINLLLPFEHSDN